MNEKQMTITTFVIFGVVIVIVLIFAFNPSVLGIVQKDRLYQMKYFDPDSITTIDVEIDDEEWSKMKDGVYHKCTVTINGDTYNDVGMKSRGATSLSDVKSHGSIRFPFKFKSDKYVDDQTFAGLHDIKLFNLHLDPTAMKEFLSYELMTKLGVPTPLYCYAAIYVNGEYFGLYEMVESIEKDFVVRNYGSGHGHLYRPKYYTTKDANGKNVVHYEGSNLKYIDDDVSSYKRIFSYPVFKKTDKKDNQRVVTALKHINEIDNIEEYVDVDEVIRYIAGNAVLPSKDTFTNGKNYYLYESDGKLAIFPWDYNLSFGTISYGSATTAVNVNVKTYGNSNALIKAILSVDEYKEQYYSYLKYAAEEFLGQNLTERIDELDSLIDEYIKYDPTFFYSYDEYKSGIAALKQYGNLRAQAILQQLDGNTTKVDASNINFSAMGLYSERSKIWSK